MTGSPDGVAASTPSTEGGWVTLSAATTLLGVSASTVRRWADAGMVRTFVTPGGHRRFSRAGLLALLPDQPTGHPTLAELGETPDRMAHGYRQAAHHGLADLPFVERMDDEMRQRSRDLGRIIVTALLSALDSDDEAAAAELLVDAEDACEEYGRMARQQGLSSVETAEAFLHFRGPFLDELGALARRRELDATATSSLMADANRALDRLLLATLRGGEVQV